MKPPSKKRYKEVSFFRSLNRYPELRRKSRIRSIHFSLAIEPEYYTAIQNCNNAGESTEFIEFMLKMIDNTIDEMNNSKEMKDKSILLLSENEIRVLECIKKNVIIGAKDIIEQTELSDSTVRRILRKFLQDEKIETTDNSEKSPNEKYKLTE